MTYQSSWRSNFDELVRAGVHVRTYAAIVAAVAATVCSDYAGGTTWTS
jgi:hypothetical protein